MIFQYEYWKCNKNFWCGGLKVTRAVPEKHIINFFGLTIRPFSQIEHCRVYSIVTSNVSVLGYLWTVNPNLRHARVTNIFTFLA